MHQSLPDDAPPELKDSYDALLAPLLLNSALAALKGGGAANAEIALRATDRALKKELSTADKGMWPVDRSSSVMLTLGCLRSESPVSSCTGARDPERRRER